MAFNCPEQFRDRPSGMRLYGWVGDETNGVFLVPASGGCTLHVIASNGEGWEHVSVSKRKGRHNRTPSWSDMCRIKVQYHPPESEYVNMVGVR